MRVLVLLFALMVPLAAPAAGQSLAQQLEAARAAARAQLALAQDAELAPFTVEVRRRDGAYALVGEVATAAHRQRAEELARRELGAAVVNNVEVGVTRQATRIPPPLQPMQPRPPQEAAERTPQEAAAQAASPQQAAESPEHYTVRSGDTLGAIARRHGVTVQQIQQLNNLRGTNIRAGQRLRVR